ncbi:hypothetical protein [Mesorhizobium silamurunense]|uniref:hypothetical protein n=1 Tax=Mesorhizobium silamurunense TaxID=499528 RepID=UPI00177D9694|nr:hypothetical protein [Mesorhizobium silamurunense]
MIEKCIPIPPFGDRPVICVASGPSLTLKQVWQIGRARSLDRCRVIAINDNMFPCWFADIGYACDKVWWNSKNGVPGFPGLKVSLEITGYHDIRTMKNTGIEGYDDTPGCLRSGSNGGYQSVHLAAKIGASSGGIILAGFDFSDNGSREHWFGLHEGSMDKHSNITERLRLFRILTNELAKRGVKVFNATLQSNINWLPPYDLGTLLI